MTGKEEYAVVLDFLPHGYPFDRRPMHRKTAIAQAIGKEFLSLLELVPKNEIFLQPLEEVYIGEGKRDKIHHISGRLELDKLTETAKSELNFVVSDLVEKNEKKYVEFFNKAGPINMRMHQIELLPGIGKRHMLEILEIRDQKSFESFEDIKERVKLIPDPKQSIIRRIILEMEGKEKHYLFVR